jgi:NADPH:quinone reductase-like Zn-dependent oxidoreductase
LMAPQGRFGLIDDPPEFTVSAFKGKAVSIHWESMFTRSSFQTPDMIAQHHLLNDVADLIDKGVLRTTLDQTFGTINAANLKRAHAGRRGSSNEVHSKVFRGCLFLRKRNFARM